MKSKHHKAVEDPLQSHGLEWSLLLSVGEGE